MTATFWDRRSEKYEEAVVRHGALYDKTVKSTAALLDQSDVLLEVGCASGEMTLDFAPLVHSVIGIDTSGKMIEIAEQKAKDRRVDNSKYIQADVFDERLVSGSYSVIVVHSAFHLLDDLSMALTRLSKLLAPGGLLISETPCLGERSPVFRMLIGLAQRFGVAPRILSLTSSDLESLVSNNGFDIVESRNWDSEKALHWIVARKTPRVPR